MSEERVATAFIETLSKSPQMKVLGALLETPKDELTKTEIAQKAGIGRTTLYRIWQDLERMNAINPSRQIGAITLYKLNMDSPVVKTLQRILSTLKGVTEAISTIEEIKTIEEASKRQLSSEMPPSAKVLINLFEQGAIVKDRAVKLEGITEEEREAIDGLIKANLVAEGEGGLYITPLGNITAQGALKIWKGGEKGLEETISSAKAALSMIGEEIKKLRAQLEGLKE